MTDLAPLVRAALLVAGCAGLSTLLILVLKPVLVRHLLAHPNARSSHKSPTPQGAGLAVMLSVLAGSALAILIWGREAEPSLGPVLGIAAGLTIVCGIDDAFTLPVSWRFFGQTLASLALVLSLPEGFQLFPGFMPLATITVQPSSIQRSGRSPKTK